MFNFIVCDDNKVINKSVVEIINRSMMNNKIGYKVHSFYDYDDSFMKKIDEKLPSKIYILDIETPSRSGIDIARIIRAKDIESVIIFLTSHEELGYLILKSQFMFLTFICKFDDYESKLESAIMKALDVVGHKSMIRFLDHGTLYTIPSADILYITRDSVDRKSVIKTEYTEFRVAIPLIELFEMLDSNFKYSHRACIINMDRVRKINFRKKLIQLDSGETIDMLSDSYKKELVVK